MKEKLTMIECFSGIGAQKRGIDLTNLFDLQVICTSDIDKDAILSYASMHCGLTLDLIKNYNEYPSEEKMIEQLTKANIGYDPQKHKEYDWNKHKKDVKKYWLACRISNQWGDISRNGLFDLDGSGGEYSSRLVYGWYVEFEKIEPRYEDIYETDLEQYGYYKKQQSLAQILSNCHIKVFDD